MYKLKLRKILFCILLSISNTGSSQALSIDDFAEVMLKDSLRAITYRVEVSEINNTSKIFGYDLGETFFYMGDIPSSLAQLTNTSIARFKFVGKVPDKRISYWGERFNTLIMKIKDRRIVKPKNQAPVTPDNLSAVLNKITHQENQDDPANLMILNVLKITYGFSVTDVEDTCEVWVAKVADNIRLSTYADDESGHGAGSITRNDKKYYELNAFELSALWRFVEHQSQRIVYDDTGDNRKFFLKVAVDDLSTVEATNAALAPFGLYLAKEKRVEKIKLVTFHD